MSEREGESLVESLALLLSAVADAAAGPGRLVDVVELLATGEARERFMDLAGRLREELGVDMAVVSAAARATERPRLMLTTAENTGNFEVWKRIT